MKSTFVAALLAGSAITLPALASAQPAIQAQNAPDAANPDPSDAAADATIANAQAVDEAQAKIELLEQQVQALQTSIDALKVQVAPEGKPAFATAKASWAESTKISGKGFLNVSSINQNSTDLAGVKTNNAQNGTQAELKRFYIGVDHEFSPIFSGNITTDIRYNANGTTKDVLVYVKKAYLQAKFDPALTVRVGSADLPWIPFVEGIYGYRFVENTVTDRTKFGTSADWGVHALGSFAGGKINYAVSAINGAGYKTLSRSSNTIDLEGRVSVNPVKSITLALGGYSGKLGKSADNLPQTATPHRATRLTALAAYTEGPVRVGVEYFKATNWTTVTSPLSDKSNGWSAFASYAFTPKVALFGRYDWVKPSRDLNPALKDHYFNVGVNYKPVPPIDLALVYKRDKVDNGTISTSNGTIGGARDGTYNEVGVFGQFAF